MAIAALVVAVITLGLALFIHSETRDIFSRVNLILHTLPGAYDVKRCINDIERSKEDRVKVICDAPKNTHLAFIQPAPKISRFRRTKNGFWRSIRRCASYWSGDMVDESVVKESVLGKWQIKSSTIDSTDLDNLLKHGWEPFCIAGSNQIWLRKHSNQDN